LFDSHVVLRLLEGGCEEILLFTDRNGDAAAQSNWSRKGRPQATCCLATRELQLIACWDNPSRRVGGFALILDGIVERVRPSTLGTMN
jgi:hypothetical protein